MAPSITDSSFQDEVHQSDLPVLIDFHASWCGPCRMLAPTIDQMAERFEGQVKVVKADVDDCPETAQAFGVRGLPTLIFYKDGRVVNQLTGNTPSGKLAREIEALAQA